MKILLVHNSYGATAPSGENVVFEAERGLLMAGGHEVIVYSKQTDRASVSGFRLLSTAMGTPWCESERRHVSTLIDGFKPDIMHVHNTFPRMSPAIFHLPARAMVARVLTVHNYRLFCAAGNHMLGDSVCTLCYERRSVLPGLLRGCYHGIIGTIPVAAMITLHNRLGTWLHEVDGYIAQTEFQRQRLLQAGLSEACVFVKPHFCFTPPQIIDWASREDKAVFVGRLSRQKGVHILLEAWRILADKAPKLEVLGDGPERGALERAVTDAGLENKVTFRGFVSEQDKRAALSTAKLLIMPTLWFETFGIVIAEAFSFGVPVVCSDLACLPEIVNEGETGRMFPPGDAIALSKTVAALWNCQATLAAMSVRARCHHEAAHQANGNLACLEEIYRKAIVVRNQRATCCKESPGQRASQKSIPLGSSTALPSTRNREG